MEALEAEALHVGAVDLAGGVLSPERDVVRVVRLLHVRQCVPVEGRGEDPAAVGERRTLGRAVVEQRVVEVEVDEADGGYVEHRHSAFSIIAYSLSRTAPSLSSELTSGMFTSSTQLISQAS